MTDEFPSCPQSLLDALREMPTDEAADQALKQRVQERLAVSIVGVAPAVGTSPSGILGPAQAGKGIAALWLAPAFVTGALVGVGAERWYAGHRVTPAPIAAPSAVETRAMPAPLPESVPFAALSGAPERGASPSAGPPSPASSKNVDSSLAAERRLLDAARTALAHGEPGASIGSLDQHASRFPNGTLSEEREALYIRVLVALGQGAAAASRAEDFHRRFPHSLFAPVIDRALGSIPRQKSEEESKP
jgi:hypothetical protein